MWNAAGLGVWRGRRYYLETQVKFRHVYYLFVIRNEKAYNITTDWAISTALTKEGV